MESPIKTQTIDEDQVTIFCAFCSARLDKAKSEKWEKTFREYLYVFVVPCGNCIDKIVDKIIYGE